MQEACLFHSDFSAFVGRIPSHSAIQVSLQSLGTHSHACLSGRNTGALQQPRVGNTDAAKKQAVDQKLSCSSHEREGGSKHGSTGTKRNTLF